MDFLRVGEEVHELYRTALAGNNISIGLLLGAFDFAGEWYDL